jgi:hypothetical protein
VGEGQEATHGGPRQHGVPRHGPAHTELEICTDKGPAVVLQTTVTVLANNDIITATYNYNGGI